MSLLIKMEELGMFLLGIFLFDLLPYEWWWFPTLLLTPDIGMAGYAFNNKIGAFTYNLFHHKGIAIAVLLLGYFISINVVILAGVVLFSHSSLDRMLGYGLKYSSDFKNTHLGHTGKKAHINSPQGQL